MVNLWQQMLATNGNKVKELKLIMLGTSQSGSSKLIETFTEKEFTSKDSYGLGYSYYDILEAEEPVVRVGVWQCNDIENEELLQLTLETKTVEKTVVAIVLDLSKPWKIEQELRQSLNILKSSMEARIETSVRDTLKDRLKCQVANYHDRENSGKAVLPKDVLSMNIGLPIVVIGTKSDLLPQNSVVVKYLESYIRSVCLTYGAALAYTCAKTTMNCKRVHQYILSRIYPEMVSPETIEAQVLIHEQIFIPAGFDSSDIIQETLIGEKPLWDTTKTFHEIIRPESNRVPVQPEVQIDDDEVWLAQLQSSSANISPIKTAHFDTSKQNSTSPARTISKTTTSPKPLPPSDGNPDHITNFFNNLLTRTEKERKKTTNSKLRHLAQNELSHMK